MEEQVRLRRIRDDLVRAMKGREILPVGPEGLQLTADLVARAYPDIATPTRLDAFSVLVGLAFGAAVEKYQSEED